MFAVYLAAMAVINGAKTLDEVKKTVKAGFGKVLRVRVPRSHSLTLSRLSGAELHVRTVDHMDDLPGVHRLRAAIPACGDVGPVLQLHAVPHWSECPPSTHPVFLLQLLT